MLAAFDIFAASAKREARRYIYSYLLRFADCAVACRHYFCCLIFAFSSMPAAAIDIAFAIFSSPPLSIIL